MSWLKNYYTKSECLMRHGSAISNTLSLAGQMAQVPNFLTTVFLTMVTMLKHQAKAKVKAKARIIKPIVVRIV